MNLNVAITRSTRIALKFLQEHAAQLPELASVSTESGKIACQVCVHSPVEGMRQITEALEAPAVVTAYKAYYDISVTVKRDGINVNLWDHLSPAEAMKLFLRLGIDPEAKVVELDAETLAKAVEPDGGAES